MILKYQTPYGIFFNKVNFLNFCKNNAIEPNGKLTTFSFSEKFDAFDFKKKLTMTWEELAERRFNELRKKYDHIRFWYSGGKDSRFVLDLAEKINFKFDEIIFFEIVVFDNPEAKNLFVPDHYIKSGKFKHIKLDADYYESFFSDINWYTKSLDRSINAPSYLENILQYNKQQNFFQPSSNSVDLLGGITPLIWHEKTWNFIFMDHHFDMMHVSPTTESFLISENVPEMYNLYIADIVTSMESQNFFPGWNEILDICRYQTCNYFRDLEPKFKNMKTQIQLGKIEINQVGIGEKWHRYNISPKCRLIVDALEKSSSKTYEKYIKNTDWQMIEQAGTIFSKKYVLV